jgi:hypothetical protein
MLCNVQYHMYKFANSHAITSCLGTEQVSHEQN